MNPGLAEQFVFTPHTSCQLQVRRGHDGADLALLGWGSPELIARRFDRLVVASGDGIFAGIVHALREFGLRVEVLYGKGGVSRRLHRNGVPLVRVPVAGDHDLSRVTSLPVDSDPGRPSCADPRPRAVPQQEDGDRQPAGR